MQWSSSTRFNGPPSSWRDHPVHGSKLLCGSHTVPGKEDTEVRTWYVQLSLDHTALLRSASDLSKIWSNRYGKIFRTSVLGESIIVSADPKFCQFIFQRDGRLFEAWYLGIVAKLFVQDAMNISNTHRYLRSSVLKQFGMDALKQKLLSMLEEEFRAALSTWPQHESIDIKYASGTVMWNQKRKTPDDFHFSWPFRCLISISLPPSLPLSLVGTRIQCQEAIQFWPETEETGRRIFFTLQGDHVHPCERSRHNPLQMLTGT